MKPGTPRATSISVLLQIKKACAPKLRGVVAILLGWASFIRADEIWISGYYPGYRQKLLPPNEIDYSVLTHVIHFSVIPNPDGTLNTAANGIEPADCVRLVETVHRAGRKVLLGVGGASSEAGFIQAAQGTTKALLITNLTEFVALYGYDGIDIDWEPLPPTDFAAFGALIRELRTALSRLSPNKLLTAAASAYPSRGDTSDSEYRLYASLQSNLDHISIMTYDLAGPYPGWVTWFNSPIYNAGEKFPNSEKFMPSAHGAIKSFVENGVSPSKLSIGIAFYGSIWSGGGGTSTGGTTRPRQTWTNAPAMIQASYHDIMTTFYRTNDYRWDDDAKAAYLSIDEPGSADDKFITYDDEQTCEAKVGYFRDHSLGGIVIWELGQAWFAERPAGHRDPLLQSIKKALAVPSRTNGTNEPRDH